MKALHEKVNIVPLIAKADCLIPSEIKKLKERVSSAAFQLGGPGKGYWLWEVLGSPVLGSGMDPLTKVRHNIQRGGRDDLMMDLSASLIWHFLSKLIRWTNYLKGCLVERIIAIILLTHKC